ncbi:MAG: hypothetical protein U9P81_10410 [Euryarchaeota archaeon]|jgi:hypothetical protein|nr:hypothetical protein [Euryarchaeota archaeon]
MQTDIEYSSVLIGILDSPPEVIKIKPPIIDEITKVITREPAAPPTSDHGYSAPLC